MSVSECSAQRVRLPVRTGKGSRVGAAPPSGTQRHPESRLSGFIVLVEVQPEAKKPKAFIGAGRQQHQKLLHDALRRKRRAVSGGPPQHMPPQPRLGWFLPPDRRTRINTPRGRCPKGKTAAPGTQAHPATGSRVHRRECTIRTFYLKESPFCPKFYKNKQNSKAADVKKKEEKKKACSFFQRKTRATLFILPLS